MTAHTPGPWNRQKSYATFYVEARLPDGLIQEVAAIGPTQHTEQQEANAKLIAAAPDLLAALNAMMTHMGMDEDEWNKPTFDQARSAIAKATGD